MQLGIGFKLSNFLRAHVGRAFLKRILYPV